ncbi:MAG: hypothetical protein JHD15_08820 [Phenylobacterium sp.]|uniref:M10 family metallopeptidase C-terminal domain-containing protein n=1 Tax=Phenylobacterium sp. TaxID=1871053 RepID=UPI001A1FBD1C|nr:hypothetical protein [Phenylobacterium sp.]MBJ7410451.1 hypothetical protein [Phenylobacterium sp.]
MARIDGTSGADNRHGTESGDVMYMKGGNDVASGWAGHDRIYGEDGNDRLNGNEGNDTLNGGAGRDTLSGGSGADLLIGGGGGDELTGGPGLDVFQWNTVSAQGGSYVDTMMDFNHGDRIDLSGIDANWNRDGNQAFHFIGRGQFSGQAGELRYSNLVIDGVAYLTDIYADVDGDRQPDFYLSINGGLSMYASDFIL